MNPVALLGVRADGLRGATRSIAQPSCGRRSAAGGAARSRRVGIARRGRGGSAGSGGVVGGAAGRARRGARFPTARIDRDPKPGAAHRRAGGLPSMEH